VRRRFVLLVTAVTAMVALAFLVPLALLIRDVARDRALTDAERTAQAVVPVLTVTDQPGAVSRALRSTDLEDEGLSVYLGDRVVGDQVEADDDVRLALVEPTTFSTEVAGGVAVLTSVVGPDGELAAVRVFVPDADLTAGVARAWTALGLVGLGLLLVAAVVADRLGRGTVRPVKELAAAAERLGQGDLSARVTPSGPPELVQVGQAFNELVERVRRQLASERELVADLSHRLRTPLTALRLDAEGVAPPELAARLAEDVDAIEQAVDELIAEARSGHRDGTADLHQVARDRFDFWSALAEEQGRSTDFDGDGRLPVCVPPAELAAAVDALLGNVFAHTPESVGFTVCVGSAGGRALLVVEDDGPGFDPAAVARGSSTGSTGLGLDIVRRTAEAAGGEVEVAHTGPGARVEVLLPLAGVGVDLQDPGGAADRSP
jgi:signal transduction histidine kinase